jgi:hypothetical protein
MPDVKVATVWIDGWDMTYRQSVKADGRTWQAESSTLQVENVTPGTYMVDVSEPFAPVELGTIPTDGLVGTQAGHIYWIGDPMQAPRPRVRATRALNTARLQETNYLAVAPLEFHAALEPLIALRQTQGLTPAVVDVQAVYDTFGDGKPNPDAIQALVRSLPQVRYLLLVGDGSATVDGYDDTLRVVAPLTRTLILGETPADGLLGTNTEGHFTVAVGRFPATSVKDVAAMVDKTIAWETHTQVPTALVLSDDEREFEIMAEEIVTLLPKTFVPKSLNAGDDTSREDTLNTLKQGPTWLNYTGHGSLTILCDEGVLQIQDGEAWNKPTLVVAWTCLAAHFTHPTQASIGETWMRVPQGGAVAFLGPVGETTTSEQEIFIRAFYEAANKGERLGDSWLAALAANGSQDVTLGYTLLGDPALCLHAE